MARASLSLLLPSLSCLQELPRLGTCLARRNLSRWGLRSLQEAKTISLRLRVRRHLRAGVILAQRCSHPELRCVRDSSSNPTQTTGFSLGHGFPLIPPKLVTKILRWEYVSILPDNLELASRAAEAQSSASCSSKAPKKRELSEDWKGLVAWSVCFSTYAAIIAKEHPEKFQQLLAYHATILIEALRFGCKGWLSYDKVFREHIEKEPDSNWSMLHPMLYSLSFLVD